ncbi:MAG: amidohydrolase family protein, partial [Cyclobacteriaceae bacterium]
AVANRFPIVDQRSFYTGGLPKEGEKAARYKASFDKMLAVVYDLFQKGVPIVAGTDGLPGFLYHRELELYVKAGIPASEVLKIATIKSAEITGVSQSVGSIEVGKQADLILIDGNPLEQFSDIRKVEWTMKGGHLYYAKELYNALGVKHFK